MEGFKRGKHPSAMGLLSGSKGENKEVDTPVCCFAEGTHGLSEGWAAAYRLYAKEHMETDLNAPGRPKPADW